MHASAPRRSALTLTAVVALGSAAPASAADEDPEIQALTKPVSSVEGGFGYLTQNAPRFGQYTGLDDKGGYGLLDFSLVRRDDATGTWLDLKGRSVGLDSREIRFSHSRQADWAYHIELDQTPRLEPYTVSTRLLGIGTGNQAIRGLPVPQNVELATKRTALGLGFDKGLPGNLDLQVRFRNEEKKGARLYGQGFFGTINFLAEPVDYTTRQVDVTLGYAGERLQLSAGYYGTDFSNDITALNVTGGIAGLTPMALPPGNQSHQFHLTGGYNFTATTRATFKAAYTHQTQTEGFIVPSITGRNDLGGRINTTLVHAALSSRPLPKLAVQASVRYEDRDDATPIAQYLTAGILPTSTLDGTNSPYSLESLSAKAEASYALPAGFRLSGGAAYETRRRNTYRVRSVSFRHETEEWSLRTELRRPLSETVTGALSYAHADRGGSEFLTTVLNNNARGSNLVHPLHLADRQRDNVRASLNWQVSDPLAVQVYADYGKDRYSGRQLGPRRGETQTYAIDATYAVSDAWQASAWLSRNDVKVDQSMCVAAGATGVCPGTVASPIWSASLRDAGNAAGVSVRGKPSSLLEVGADLTHLRDRSEYRLSAISPGAVIASLPDVHFRATRLALFARYAFQKHTAARLGYTYERWATDDWTWTTWTYSDGTRVLQAPIQRVHFIGLTLSHRWQ